MGMKRTLGISVAWLGATILAVVVAAAAVGSVRSEVTESPTALGSPAVATLALDTATEAAPDPATEPKIPDTTTLALPQASEPTTEPTTPKEPVPTSSTSTTSPGVGTPATSTTSTSQPPTPTTTAPAQVYKTFDTAAGSVRVIVQGNTVTFGGAFPKPGWSVELEKAGPESVEVKFETNDDSDEIEFHAKIEDGELKVSISGE